MANRAFLFMNLSGDPNEALSPYALAAGASYCYPVLWWSIFSHTDIVVRTADWEDDDGNPVLVPVPSPPTSLTTAKQRARARQRRFYSFFPRSVEPIYQQWLTLLDGIDAPYLQLITGEDWGMSEPERSDAEIATYVRAFEEGRTEDWVALLKQVCITLDPATKRLTYRSLGLDDKELPEAEAELGYRLRGYEWERPVPWSDE